MNHEQFIEKNLLNSAKSQHPAAVSITKEITDRTLALYREQGFECLDGLISCAISEIELKSSLIECLSKNGGTTASECSEAMGVSVKTARARLNASKLAVCNRQKRPFIYTLAH